MVNDTNIFRCDECGSIIEVLVPGKEESEDKGLTLLEAQTEGEKAGKHKPVITIDGDSVNVKIGEIQHPSEEEHYIQFIELTVGSETYTKHLQAGDVPEATFLVGADKLSANDVVAKEYCNVHGLWSSE